MAELLAPKTGNFVPKNAYDRSEIKLRPLDLKYIIEAWSIKIFAQKCQ